MRNFWRLFLLGATVAAVPTLASAQSIGLNFAADDPSAEVSSMGATDVAGVVPQDNWNNLMGAMGTGVTGLVLDDGTSSGISVTWNSNNTWRSTDSGNNEFPEGGDRTMTAGYLDYLDDPVTPIEITIEGIDAELQDPNYDVYVYFVSDSGENRGGGYTIDNGTDSVLKYGSTLDGPTEHIEDPGTDPDNSEDGTYLRFRRLEGSSFTLTADAALTTPAGFRAVVNGLQIVPRPAPGDVDGNGSVGVEDFNLIAANFFKTGQTDMQGDLVGTGGVVDFADYREWKQHAPAEVVASVAGQLIPEPTSGALLVMSGALAAFARRRTGRRALDSAA